MKISPFYRSPVTGLELEFNGEFDDQGRPYEGIYLTKNKSEEYLVRKGLPDFCYPKVENLPSSDRDSLNWYKNNAEFYDEYLPLTFKTFKTDEIKEREHLVDLLEIKGDETILEFGCGTGRDSELIAKRLNNNGKLFLQDISPEILFKGINKFKLNTFLPEIEFSISNAYYLPFQEKYFDKVFHFGGLNTFGDLKKTFDEIIRVSKVGAKVVIGDESMPIWLRDTEFGKILMNSNSHYKFSLPLKYIPQEARNVKIEWIIGGVFYVISFEVGEGEPYADFDFEIPGSRGGSHRTRYYGNLEGVSKEACEIAKKASSSKGESMHLWLDKIIKEAGRKDLENI